MKLPHQISEATRRRNPEIFGALGGLPATQRERDTVPSLEQKPQRKPKVQGTVAVVVTIVAYRKRLLDDDNNTGSLKHLRDCIAESMGVNDADKRVAWCYGQVQTRGKPGTLVKIEMV